VTDFEKIKKQKEEAERQSRQRAAEDAQKVRIAADKLLEGLEKLLRSENKSQTKPRRQGNTVILEYQGQELALAPDGLGNFEVRVREFGTPQRQSMTRTANPEWYVVNRSMPEMYMADYVFQWLDKEK